MGRPPCRLWSGFPGAKPFLASGERRPPSECPGGEGSSRVRRFLHSHTHTCAHAGAPVTGAANVLVGAAMPSSRESEVPRRISERPVSSPAEQGLCRPQPLLGSGQESMWPGEAHLPGASAAGLLALREGLPQGPGVSAGRSPTALLGQGLRSPLPPGLRLSLLKWPTPSHSRLCVPGGEFQSGTVCELQRGPHSLGTCVAAPGTPASAHPGPGPDPCHAQRG